MADIAVGAALQLAEIVISLIQEESSGRNDVKTNVDILKKQLQTLQVNLKGIDGAELNDIKKDRVREVRDIAYAIEDALDEFMYEVWTNNHTHSITKTIHKTWYWYQNRTAYNKMAAKIKDIQTKRDGAVDFDQLLSGIDSVRNGLSSSNIRGHRMSIVTPHITEEDEILSFDKPREEIIKQLFYRGETVRKTVAVVGPPGSGKSTLMKMIYNEVRGKFDCHAWLHVTRSFNIGELLQNLLYQICAKQEGADARESLRDHLKHKKYIVVLDDIWCERDWKTIVKIFPTGLAGSAIIFTTRSTNVASSCHHIHHMRALSKEAAWELFCHKTFNAASNWECPAELIEWSQKIVARCEQLPLHIVEIGRFLSTKRKHPIEWKKLHDSLRSEIGSNASNLSVITKAWLSSYNDLSSHLKSCFLYMGIFPEDYSIKRERLIRLWVAEGFVEKIHGKTLEDVAEDYLNELIERNLVLPTTIDFDGRIRSCKVRSLVSDFIFTKSQDHKFVAILSESNTSSSYITGSRRLVIHNAYQMNLLQREDFSYARTFLMFGRKGVIYDLLGQFKLLKVLDMQGVESLHTFPEQICELFLLRYLSLRHTRISSIPKSIRKLTCLETLDLKHTEVTKLPRVIWKLMKLRHLLVYNHKVNNYVSFDSETGVMVYTGIGSITSIQKLSLVRANSEEGSIVEELGKLVQLRKLGLVDLKKEDGQKLCLSIQNMPNLSTLDIRSRTPNEYLDVDAIRPPAHLQRLYLKGLLSKLPRTIGSLTSLVRIGLKWSRLRESPFDILEDLPNLIELQMIDAFIGTELVFKAEMFKKLNIIYIDKLENLSSILVEQGAIPEVRKLTMCRCNLMKSLPSGMDHANKIGELLLYDMSNEFIAKLGSHRWMVDHVSIIHSFNLVNNRWSRTNHSREIIE